MIAIWNDVNNISNYKVQKSTDNITWTNVSTPSSATSTISATGTLYVRVACVIGSVIGDYTSGVIIAT